MRKSNYINIDDKLIDTPIYRIMPIYRFFKLLDDRKLALVKPEKWDDPYENALLNSTIVDSKGDQGWIEAKNSVYGQCWSFHRETDAMWRIYSHIKDGVKISTTPKKLLTALNKNVGNECPFRCFIGSVSYLTNEKILDKFQSLNLFSTDNTGIAESLLYKRDEFKHENEIRLIYCGEDDKCTNDIFLFDVDPVGLIDDIVFDPRMDENLKLAYTLAFKSKGFNFNVVESTLYDAPKKIIIKL